MKTFTTLEQSLETNLPVVIVNATEFEHKGNHRQSLTVRKARGKRLYNVVRYENGRYSEAV